MISAILRIESENPGRVVESLKSGADETERFTVEVTNTDKNVELKVSAKDVPSMRAALNSYLRLVGMVKDLES